nr:hypothetical protein [Tanacetum cinerariifolium]
LRKPLVDKPMPSVSPAINPVAWEMMHSDPLLLLTDSIQSDEEPYNFFEVDDETDVWFMMQVYKYNQRLQGEQNRPRLTRNPIFRERDDAKARLMRDYFIDGCKNGKIVQNHGRGNTVPDANNSIIFLDNSLLFDELLDDIALVTPFVVNGVGFENGYYLADEIYPQWKTFVKSFWSQMTRNVVTLKGDRKVHERMSNVLLVFSKDVEE